ncbi:MAG: transglutaminase-like domain-containing protein [Nitrospirota bacterium]
MFRLSKSPSLPSQTLQTAQASAEKIHPLTDGAIAALVTLLERESKRENVAIIRCRLEELGALALPWLDAAAAERDTRDGAAAALATHIRRQALDAEWSRWAGALDADLEGGALLIDRFGDPLRDPSEVSHRLDQLADRLGRQLTGASDVEEKLTRLRAFLFSQVGFRGNTASYDDPRNSYLSDVLARRRGIPVSLSVVVMLLARRLNLPIVGVGMPGHFLVRYGTQPSGPYLDAFGGGRVLTREDCAAWLRASGLTFDPRMLRPVGPRYIVARMLRNLVAVFTKRGASTEAQLLTGYLKRVVGVSESGAAGVAGVKLPDADGPA